jgi:hypothetical protein
MRALRPGTRMLAVAVVVVLALASVRAGAGKPPPPRSEWPPGAVDIKTVSNGCGPTSAVTYKNRQTYARDEGETITVSFRDACDLHDAAYSGAYVWDPINEEFVDFSDPKWTKQTINEKFKRDLQRSCSIWIPVQPIWLAALDRCLTEDNTSLVRTWGAPSYYDMVTDVLNPIGPRQRIQLDGSWRNQNPGFPACDIGANPWTIAHVGRKVTARWEHGTSGTAVGQFVGTFITGDALGDDRVTGPYEITDGGKVLGKGEMTFVVHSDGRFDFSSTGIAGSGTMQLRAKRTTQSAAVKCRTPKQPGQTAKPASPAGSFVLTGSRVVENPYGKEVNINVAGGNATWDRCCDGARWKTQYTWNVPRSLTPGKPFSISVSLETVSVEPSQPLYDQMSALAPDFRQDLGTNYPGQPSASKTYSVPFSAGYRTDPNIREVKVYVNFAHASVEYTYRRSGA